MCLKISSEEIDWSKYRLLKHHKVDTEFAQSILRFRFFLKKRYLLHVDWDKKTISIYEKMGL